MFLVNLGSPPMGLPTRRRSTTIKSLAMLGRSITPAFAYSEISENSCYSFSYAWSGDPAVTNIGGNPVAPVSRRRLVKYTGERSVVQCRLYCCAFVLDSGKA